ncbi:MAG TPA: DUF4333 domain-containing protein [Solirubrobacterales bacterium]|nr:DUF4333 domain-containing protein [Solirubrobacterales bacterium]
MPALGSVALGSLVALALAGCSAEAEVSVGGESLDPDATAETISTGLGDQSGLPDPGVDCDGIQNIPVEEGSDFTCTGTDPADGETFSIEVTLTDSDGGYRYEVP